MSYAIIYRLLDFVTSKYYILISERDLSMSVPNWVQDSIFYQIFPDRFYNGDQSNDPFNVQTWGSPPTIHGFQGGDLRGITGKLDYLIDLGINALYLNPIFASASNHGYHTDDYYKINPCYGTMADFKDLLDGAHSRGIKVVLDGVFNHTGRGFFAFHDLLENGKDSAYKDWYHVKKFPLDAYGDGKSKNYEAWWGLKPLPKLNTDNPRVRRYIFDVAKYWIDQGIDGWRLDVPGEINDDDFWAEFRGVVRAANPQAYLVGEIWELDPRWVGDGHFDGLMHYPLRNAVIDLLTNDLPAPAFAELLEGFVHAYPPENTHAMYVPLGSHDTSRLVTLLGGHIKKTMLAFLLQFAYPGAPAIYYGDEIGLRGGKDPACRGAFPWDESRWNHEIREYIKGLIRVRKEHAALRRGDLKMISSADDAVCAFARTLGEEAVLAAANPTQHTRQVRIQTDQIGWGEDREVKDLLTGKPYQVRGNAVEVTLPAWSGALFG